MESSKIDFETLNLDYLEKDYVELILTIAQLKEFRYLILLWEKVLTYKYNYIYRYFWFLVFKFKTGRIYKKHDVLGELMPFCMLYMMKHGLHIDADRIESNPNAVRVRIIKNLIR